MRFYFRLYLHNRDDLEWLTQRIIEHRKWRLGKNMPIKWNITGKAMAARGIMDQISTEYDGFIADGAEHLGDLKALRGQVDEMKVDLYGAANIMGNSGGGSEPQKPPVVSQTVPPVVHLPPPSQNAPAPTAVPLVNTFRAEAEQQIAAGHK